MEKFTVHTGTAVPLRRSDVDTDQIIPARFCTNPSRTGYADVLFADWRNDPGFVLNQPSRRGATVLVAGRNFGTGSSREAAVWALQNFGFRAVIASQFADIFRSNSLMSGLLTVVAPTVTVSDLWDLVEADATTPVTVDLERLQVRYADVVVPFTLDEEARLRLLSGLDPIAATLAYADEIAAYESRRRPALPTSR